MKTNAVLISKFLIFLFICSMLSHCGRQAAPDADFVFKQTHVIQLDSGGISLSACVVNDRVYVLSGVDNGYFRIDMKSGEFSRGVFPVGFRQPTSITYSRNRIIVSDITDQSLTFFDRDMRFKKRVVLNRFPLDARVHGNRCVYLTDLMQDQIYNFILVDENILNRKERIIFSGDTLNTTSLRESLNLDIPGTICFDYDGRHVFAARQRYDSYVIYRLRPDRDFVAEEFIRDREWSPIEYSETEYLAARAVYSKILDESHYPLDQLVFSHKIAILSLAADIHGRLWVVSSGPGNSLSLNLYSPTGAKIRNMVFDGIDKAKILVSATHFALLETDTAHPRIFIYEMTKN